jgi:hypothetical protein
MELALLCCLVLSGFRADVSLEVIKAESYNLVVVKFGSNFVGGFGWMYLLSHRMRVTA